MPIDKFVGNEGVYVCVVLYLISPQHQVYKSGNRMEIYVCVCIYIYNIYIEVPKLFSLSTRLKKTMETYLMIYFDHIHNTRSPPYRFHLISIIEPSMPSQLLIQIIFYAQPILSKKLSISLSP